jgi:hypothetical protein
MKNFFKKLTGLARLEAARDEAEQLLAEAQSKLEEARKTEKAALEAEELAKLTPKERANKKGEPWVSVLNTHVNKDNVRNGFFELDWNDHFVLKLKQEGYGFDGDKDEEIVDRWFRELCAGVVVDEGITVPVNTGIVDINQVKKNLGK